jgi:Hg(II)-responsive transcriptional regulator
MNIGQVASKAGVAPATVRYYEQRGLIPEVPRTDGGYRQYGDDAVNRLRFIKRAQRIGFSLDDIHELLELHRRDACPQVQARAIRKMQFIEERITELTKMQHQLEKLATRCGASVGKGECGFLAALDDDEFLE